MIPLTFLYDDYIDWPKFSEQKKPFEYIVPPPTSGVGTKALDSDLKHFKLTSKSKDYKTN